VYYKQLASGEFILKIKGLPTFKLYYKIFFVLLLYYEKIAKNI